MAPVTRMTRGLASGAGRRDCSCPGSRSFAYAGKSLSDSSYFVDA
jgi:hypothetical protein